MRGMRTRACGRLETLTRPNGPQRKGNGGGYAGQYTGRDVMLYVATWSGKVVKFQTRLYSGDYYLLLFTLAVQRRDLSSGPLFYP